MRKIVLCVLSSLCLVACKKESPENTPTSETAISDASQTSEYTSEPKIPQVFEKIAANTSNINFNNTVKENVGTLENLFDFDYFYNGAGVGVADINNDGLKDIFFCGNQVPNKLYLNKGGLVFEDISVTANINQNKAWSNGVTFADVNGDGWLDIYVSQGGPKPTEQRENLLFINQKDLSFKEEAKKYGLADNGISTQTAFFDFDKDGDLDCVVSNENPFYGLDPVSFAKAVTQSKENLHSSCGHLYRNDGGKFVDVTEKAGLLQPAFGLGLCVSDINEDGWLDIYVANDYYVPDAMYINNKNGTFTDQVKQDTNQISFYGMGVDIADINNDGLQDIFVLDMASSDHVRSKTLMASMNTEQFDLLVKRINFPYQYMFNSMQLNQGNNKYHNVAQLSGLSKTDWSWAGLIVDFDLDSKKDIYVSNGYRRYALDNDLKQKVTKAKQQYKGRVPLAIKQQLYDAMPSERLPNIMFKNKSQLKFEDVAQDWGLGTPSFSNGASYADLDNDGDLDLVVNNMDDAAFLYKNLSVENNFGNFLKVKAQSSTSEPFAKVKITYGGQVQMIETKRVKGYLSATDNEAYFGLGDAETIDKVTVTWLSGKVEERLNIPVNEVLVFNEKDAKSRIKTNETPSMFAEVEAADLGLDHAHIENEFDDFEKEVLLPYKQSTLGPFIAKGDVNNDGKEDLYLGGGIGQPGQLFIQGSKSFQKKNVAALTADAGFEDMEAVFFDADSDGDNDLYVVSGGNEFPVYSKLYMDRLYLNDGAGNFTRSTDAAISNQFQSGKTVTAIDFDNDGDQDLVVGNRIIPQNYPRAATSTIYRNDAGSFTIVTDQVAPELSNLGIVNKVIASDFNNDGWQDLVAVSEWGHVAMLQNNNGTFEDVSDKSKLTEDKGWWFSVAETDVNNDGLKDYVVGNVGLNIKFKASHEKPFKVFANDFDGNGTLDIVLSQQYNGNYVPVRGKECSTQQMPFISEKFKTYNEFANATLVDVYGDKVNDAYSKEVTEFRSMVLINKGNGMFDRSYLPNAAQAFPILDCTFEDINKDGYDDVVLVGNLYDTEVETPRLDGGAGLVLLSNQKDNYNVVPTTASGLYFHGNTKSLESVSIGGKKYLLAAKNNDRMSVVRVEK